MPPDVLLYWKVFAFLTMQMIIFQLNRTMNVLPLIRHRHVNNSLAFGLESHVCRQTSVIRQDDTRRRCGPPAQAAPPGY